MAKPRKAKISEVKAHFSAYVRRAANGERITIFDRDQPVAELGPVPVQSDDFLARLAREGRVVLPNASFDGFVFAKPDADIDAQAALQAIRDER